MNPVQSFQERAEIDLDISGGSKTGWSGHSWSGKRREHGDCSCYCDRSYNRWGVCRFGHILQEVEILVGTRASNAELLGEPGEAMYSVGIFIPL